MKESSEEPSEMVIPEYSLALLYGTVFYFAMRYAEVQGWIYPNNSTYIDVREVVVATVGAKVAIAILKK